MPPLPTTIGYREVARRLDEGRYDFLLTPNWAFHYSAGTLYLSDESPLAGLLSLPMLLAAYEDLATGQIVLTGKEVESKKFQTLAIVDAPAFSRKAPAISWDKYWMRELGPRRLIWTALLQSESDVPIIVHSATSAGSGQEMVASPLMMDRCSPEQITDFRMIQGGANREELSVQLPVEFVGSTITLKESTNLFGIGNSILQTNIACSGTVFLANARVLELVYETRVSTNRVDCAPHTMPGAPCMNQMLVVSTNRYPVGGGVVFYHVSASSTVDTDGDGLDNVSEYDAGTNYQDADSDDDALSDGDEVSTYGLDPNRSDTNGDGVPDAIDARMQGTTGNDGLLIILPDGEYRHMSEAALNLNAYGAYGRRE